MTLYAKWTLSTEPVDPEDPSGSGPTDFTKPTGSTAQSSPQTGDDSIIALWSTILLNSLAMMGTLSWVAIRKRRKNMH